MLRSDASGVGGWRFSHNLSAPELCSGGVLLSECFMSFISLIFKPVNTAAREHSKEAEVIRSHTHAIETKEI